MPPYRPAPISRDFPELNENQRKLLLRKLLTLLGNESRMMKDDLTADHVFAQPLNVIIERLEGYIGINDV